MDLSALGLPMEQLRDVANRLHGVPGLVPAGGYRLPGAHQEGEGSRTVPLRYPVRPLMRRSAPPRNAPRWVRR